MNVTAHPLLLDSMSHYLLLLIKTAEKTSVQMAGAKHTMLHSRIARKKLMGCLIWGMRWSPSSSHSSLFSFVWFVEWNGLIHDHLITHKLTISICTRNMLIPPKFMGWTHDASPHLVWGGSSNQTHPYIMKMSWQVKSRYQHPYTSISKKKERERKRQHTKEMITQKYACMPRWYGVTKTLWRPVAPGVCLNGQRLGNSETMK